MPRTSTVSETFSSTRRFGVEIEFVGIRETAAAQALASAGLVVDHRSTGQYNHRNSATAWKVVSDASVNGNGGSGEVVSPILKGNDGLIAAEKAAKALVLAGATVNRSCGLHVHVDAAGLSAADIRNVVFRYARFESKIDEIMPRSRRDSAGQYCRSLSQWVSPGSRARAAIERATTVDQVIRSVYERFLKLNISAYNRHGTLEFRHHSGTVNAEKIVNWIKFCVNFVETSQEVADSSNRRASVNSRGNASGRARNSKTLVAYHKIVNTLRASGHVGGKLSNLASLTGLSEASVVVYISKLRSEYGFNIKKDRGRDAYVLRRQGSLPALAGDAPAVANTSTPVQENDTAFRGLPASVVGFYAERVVDLQQGGA